MARSTAARTTGRHPAHVSTLTNSHLERYFARRGADTAAAQALAVAGYTIEVRFVGGLNTRQKNAFKHAAKRWTQVITGDLPDVIVDGETIKNLLILAEGAPIDGPGKVLGQAGPTRLRPSNAGAAAFLPAKGEMTFDTDKWRMTERWMTSSPTRWGTSSELERSGRASHCCKVHTRQTRPLPVPMQNANTVACAVPRTPCLCRSRIAAAPVHRTPIGETRCSATS
jgi:hypothetical protein